MVTKYKEYFMDNRYFGMGVIPIEFEHDENKEYLKDLYYVDYCNNCKDLDVMDSKEVPCHHPWYCWNDNGEVQDVEFRLGRLYENEKIRGYLFASERELLFKLKEKKFELVKSKLKEYRRQNR